MQTVTVVVENNAKKYSLMDGKRQERIHTYILCETTMRLQQRAEVG